jgi:lipid-A-disaccharide synthase-like uncharacterized protein
MDECKVQDVSMVIEMSNTLIEFMVQHEKMAWMLVGFLKANLRNRRYRRSEG